MGWRKRDLLGHQGGCPSGANTDLCGKQRHRKNLSSFLLRDKFGDAFSPNSLTIAQHLQRAELFQQFIWLEQVHGMSRPFASGETRMLLGISLVDEDSAGRERTMQSREELSLKIKEDQNQVVGL